MGCTAPIIGYRTADGKVKMPKGELTLAHEKAGAIGLPCGRCLDCRITRQRDWALRCQHEAQFHKHKDGSSNTCFLTLTYDDEHLPNDWSVDVRAWQLFAKKTRKRLGSFRFLAVGEYGGEKLRPHYHALIFGQDFSHDRVPMTDADGNPYFLSATLAKLWPQGIHHIQLMTQETVNYCCRYTIDKIQSEEELERINPFTGEVWTVAKPFAVMSRGGRTGDGGIGSKWYKTYHKDVFPRDKIISNGRELPVPRYYTKKLKEENEELAAIVQGQRDKFTAATAVDRTPERRHVKGKVTAAKMKLRKKSKLD